MGVEDLDYYPHFAYGHRKTSFSKVVLDKFAQSIGIEFQYVPLPIKRMQPSFQQGKIDFRYPDNVMWQEPSNSFNPVIYSTPLVTSIAGTTVRKENLGKGRESIHSVATLLGFYPGLWSDKLNDKEFKFLYDSSVPSVVNMGLNNIVDALDLDYSVINFHLKQMGNVKALVLEPQLPVITVTFSLSTIQHVELVNQFNHFVKDNQAFIAHAKKQFNIIETPFDLNSF